MVLALTTVSHLPLPSSPFLAVLGLNTGPYQQALHFITEFHPCTMNVVFMFLFLQQYRSEAQWGSGNHSTAGVTELTSEGPSCGLPKVMRWHEHY